MRWRRRAAAEITRPDVPVPSASERSSPGLSRASVGGDIVPIAGEGRGVREPGTGVREPGTGVREPGTGVRGPGGIVGGAGASTPWEPEARLLARAICLDTGR